MLAGSFSAIELDEEEWSLNSVQYLVRLYLFENPVQ